MKKLTKKFGLKAFAGRPSKQVWDGKTSQKHELFVERQASHWLTKKYYA